jgi:hypothetical protein
VKSTGARRALEFALLAVTTFFGVQYGLPGVAAAVGFSAVVVMIIMMRMITKVTKVSWSDYFGSQLPAITTSLGMLAVMYFSRNLLETYLDPLGPLMLLSMIGIGAISYLGLHLLFRFRLVIDLLAELRGDTRSVAGALKKKFSRSRKKRVVVAESDG